MLDLHRLPSDFPGYQDATLVSDPLERVASLEESFRKDIDHHLDQFIPYVQPYEFEALLFSNLDAFRRRFPNREEEIAALRRIRAACTSPEHIDDDDPPSKRILSAFPDYDKVGDGPILSLEIGLEAIRDECQHFHDWIGALEEIGQQG